MVGSGGGTYTDANVDLPFRQTDLLLVMQRVKSSNAPVISVVSETTADLTSEIVADLDAGREAEYLLYIGVMPRVLKRRVEAEVPALDGFIDNATDLPCPDIRRIDGSLVADVGRQTESYGRCQLSIDRNSRYFSM